MTVQIATLDILTERAHFTPEVARALGDAMAMEISSASKTLATRQDIAELRAEFRSELRVTVSEAKSDIVRWMFAALATHTVVILGAVYFMIQHLC